MMKSFRAISALFSPASVNYPMLGLFGMMLCVASCHDHEVSYMSDDHWLRLGQQTPIHGTFSPKEEGSGTLRRLRTLGFVQQNDGTWRREAILDKNEVALPLAEGSLKNIDAVGILSIDRHNGSEPYIYSTLQSLFSELPEGSTVNVFVGDDDDTYVSYPVLKEKIGEKWARQVNVIPTEARTAEHFRRYNYSLVERATWNYARMLRAYKGSKHYLVTEDDVSWGVRSISYLDHMLQEPQPSVISTYNWRCGKLPGGSASPMTDIEILSMPLHWYHKRFSGLQAMLFSAKDIASIGNHLLMHAGRKPHDLELDHFLRSRDLHIGVTQPSMVQHEGVKTTGLGYHHTSQCFLPIFPAL